MMRQNVCRLLVNMEVRRDLMASFAATHPRGGVVVVAKALHRRHKHSREMFVDEALRRSCGIIIITARDTNTCLGSAVYGFAKTSLKPWELELKIA